MAEAIQLVVSRPGLRLDKYLAEELPQLSRSQAQKLIQDGYVTVNDLKAKPSLKLQVGDRVGVTMPPPTPSPLTPEPIPITIVYEDQDLLVIDKPAGLPVHPAPGHPSHTLVNAILAHYPDLPGRESLRPGVVHRLDKDTSGLMLVAKNSAAQANLSRQLKERSMLKRYLILVQGRLSPERGAIEAPIGRHPTQRQRMAIVSGGREARTSYRIVQYLPQHTLVEATLETGRTHQLRVHFSAIGHPVLGDRVYGKGSPLLARQFVHAHYLRFRLPSTGEEVEFRSELPPDLRQALEQLSG